MPHTEIAKINVTMSNLKLWTREQNKTRQKMLVTLTETGAIQQAESKRIDQLESSRTWLVRIIVGSVMATVFTLFKGDINEHIQ